MSLREQHEYRIMEQNVTYDDVEKVFRVKYPFLEDPSILSNNVRQAVKIAEREERKLNKEHLMDEFNEEFEKMISHGALVELSPDRMESWAGPVHYVSLQHVLKPESTTTPLRIVTNSSLSDRNGNSLNSILMKGPNALSDQRDVVSRFRSYESSLSTDFTKAYFTMRTGELELHVRRVVWRYGKSDEEWRHFGYNTVSFGDKPAGVFLNIVINQAAEKFKEIDPLVAQKIINYRYVDDIATGGSPEEVRKMAGERVDPNNKFETNGTLSRILSNGSLKLKAVLTSGEEDPDVINKLGKHVLGITWHSPSDVISIDMHVSNVLTELLNTDNITNTSLTLRKLLGIINKPHDILGLVSPITIRAMAAYRDLFRLDPALDWDHEIPLEEKVKFVEILRICNEVSSITFPRSTKPKSAVGNPEVVGYFDGSDNAYAAVVYLRWTLENGSYDINLACSKTKVTPLKRISTPRSELNGAVLLTRLVLFYLKSCTKAGVVPKKVWLLGDSECTLASIAKTSGALGEYFGNRVGEVLDNQSRIQKFCNVGDEGEWWHVPSSHNAADQPTRLDSTAESISRESSWQKGPRYLYEPVESWPIDRNFADRKDSCIPDAEILRKYRGIVHEVTATVIPDVGVHKLIDPFSTNDWDRLIQQTQILLLPFLHKRGITDNSARLEVAEKVWFRQAMEDTRLAVSEGKLKSLCVEERDGLIVVVGRARTGMQNLLGKEYLPVLMRKSRVTFLVMLWAHKENHDARDLTMSIACSKAWIIGAKRLATSITVGCVRCRFLHKLKVMQKMAELPQTWDIIAHKSSTQGTNWNFAPAGAQWRNGAVEIFVKKFKKSFELLYNKTRLNFAEMACAMKRIASVLNDRPLSIQKSVNQYPDADFLCPITPNMLLTGRSGGRAPLQRDVVNFEEIPQDRLSFVEELELAWWCQYKVQYFTSLIPTQKWINAKRNMRVDDVVLIEYKSKSFPGTYRLGRVKDVEVDNDNLVRTCTVVYKLVKPSAENARDVFKDVTSKEVRLPVQRLILILPAEEQ